MSHQSILAKRIIGLVRRRLPGVRCIEQWTYYDRILGVGFRLGRKYHGVRIGGRARNIDDADVSKIVAALT
jgi:hypothetical protein